MVDYDFSDRLFDNLTKKFIVPAFRKFALTYSVSSSIAYDTIEFCYEGTETEIDRKDMVDKFRLRLARIIEQMRFEKDIDPNEKAFYVSKLYDDKLNEVMVEAYRNLAKPLGDEIALAFPKKTLLRNLSLEDRSAFSFVEFAFLLCLFLSIRGRSLKTLSEPIETKNQLKRAIPRFRKIKDVLFSKQFEFALMGLMLDLLAEHHQKNYSDRLNCHIRDYWLPQSKRKLKTAKYAVQQHGNRVISNDYYPLEEYKKLSDVDQVRLIEDNQEVMLIQRLFYIIIPVIEALIIGALPTNQSLEQIAQQSLGSPALFQIKEYLLSSSTIPTGTKKHIQNMPDAYYTVTCEDYFVAQRIYEIMKYYYCEVQKSVVSLMETLPGFQIAGENGLWEYLINL